MDLTPVYRRIETGQLLKLKGKKVLRTMELRKKPLGYFAQQELKALSRQIIAIDAELAWRKAKMRLFE